MPLRIFFYFHLPVGRGPPGGPAALSVLRGHIRKTIVHNFAEVDLRIVSWRPGRLRRYVYIDGGRCLAPSIVTNLNLLGMLPNQRWWHSTNRIERMNFKPSTMAFVMIVPT